MNTVKSIQALNKRELENVVPPSASWHTDYRDTAYINIGGLSFDLSEGDIETIFSQYGVPTWIKLARDKETGKSRGFAWLKYEDQRSCDLAVDNLGGATVLGRVLRVDHTRYKKKEGEEEEDEKYTIHFEGTKKRPADGRRDHSSDSEDDRRKRKPQTKAEKELEDLIRTHDEDDPMKEFLINEKRNEVAAERETLEGSKKESRHHGHRRERRHDDKREDKETRHHDRNRERRHRSSSPGGTHRKRSRERKRRSRSRDHSTERHHRR